MAQIQINGDGKESTVDRFAEIEESQKEKLAVENAITANAGVVKVGSAEGVKLIPTHENYLLEQGQRSEGLPVPGEVAPLAIAQNAPANMGFNIMDAAELKLRTGEQGSATSVQHATGTSEAEPPLGVLGAAESVEAVTPVSDSEVEKLEESGRRVAAKAQKETAKAAKELRAEQKDEK